MMFEDFSDAQSMLIGEIGQVIDLKHVSQTIVLENSYANPVVFAQPLSRNGSDPAVVRIEDIKADRFTARVQEPNYKDGRHTGENFSYLVLEAGTWELENDTQLEVGTLNSDAVTNSDWEQIDFSTDFLNTPTTFSQVQTDNGSNFVRTRQKNTSARGFSLAMEEEEVLNTSHPAETLGWMAISAGAGSWNGLSYQAGNTGNRVTHEWSTLKFENSFERAPQLLASLATYDGTDSAGVRYQNVNSQGVQMMVEEDTSRDLEQSHTTEDINFLLIGGSGTLTASTPSTSSQTFFPKTREAWEWPFATESIWNLPLGSNAVYQPANLETGLWTSADNELLFQVSENAPLTRLYAPGSWTNRASGTKSPTGNPADEIYIRFPKDQLVADASPSSTPNNVASILQPDGETVVAVAPLARTKPGDSVYGWYYGEENIYGTGITGAHGGSGLSGLGGSIRLGELSDSEPIRHALKINVWADKYLYYDNADKTPGYRWPAYKADNYAADNYGGTNANFEMGSLLAIPPNVTPEQLGIESLPALKLFYALQDYGTYVVDDTAWNVSAFNLQQGVEEKFEQTYGYTYSTNDQNSQWFQEYYALVESLHLVTNNRPTAIGGGGDTRRAPLAPHFASN
ncbi:hypothetical protein [Pleurocapsa sp. FMAR1]|uniref:hypothetical protein n=1 Tax=Pleurocapsa sp. FMAR1 TaxID=3040204 RepID=UPI0029C874AD|nr:hypothetical protein [Pleurocapsa sp. FMAR1]